MSTINSRIENLEKKVGSKNFLNLIDSDGSEQNYTYSHLVSAAFAWADKYHTLGFKPGSRIVVILPHSLDLYASYLGAIFAGMIPAYFAHPSPKLSEEEYAKTIEQLTSNSNAECIITYPELAGKLNWLLEAVSSLQQIVTQAEASQGKQHEFFQAKASEVAFLQFSSGTTGLKKGVEISHQALLWQVDSYADRISLSSETDKVVTWLPIYHDMGLIACYFLPLLTGTPIVAMSPFEWVKQPSMLLDAITKHRGTLSWLPNFAYNFIANNLRASSSYELSSWRGIVNCSEPVLSSSHKLFLGKLEPFGLSSKSLWSSYAMAENTFAVTGSGPNIPLTIDSVDEQILQSKGIAQPSTLEQCTKQMVSSGTALPQTEIRIIDENNQPVSERTIGEISFKSPCQFNSYLNNEEATSDAFSDGWYNTGDLGYLANDHLYVVGRKKELIIISGKNIFPQDIESIVNQHSAIIPGRCVAIGCSNLNSGTEDLVIIAESHEPDVNMLNSIRQDLYDDIVRKTEIYPSEIAIRPHKWLLKSTSGKLSRNLNKEKFLVEQNDISHSPPEASRPQNTVDITQQVINCIQRLLPDTSSYKASLAPNQPLLSSGLISSLTMASLLAQLEEEFKLLIPDSFISQMDKLETANLISQQIQLLLKESSTGKAHEQSRAEVWAGKINKAMMKDEVSIRYQLAPQLEDSDVVSNDPNSEFGAFTMPNYKSKTLNTDSEGFRVCLKNDEVITREAFFERAETKGIIAGNSTAFSVGASNDQLALHNRLNTSTESIWYNLSLRASNTDQEKTAVTKYCTGPLDKFVWLSGYNTLKFLLFEIAKQLADHSITAKQHLFLNKDGFVSNYQRYIANFAEDITRVANHLNGIGCKNMLFYLQPNLTWLSKPLTPEEKELLIQYDYHFKRAEARVVIAMEALYETYKNDVSKICSNNGIAFHDLNSESQFGSDKWLFLDRIHLTDSGFDIITEDLINRMCLV